MTFVRLWHVEEGTVDRELILGPFEDVQITGALLRDENGEMIAWLSGGCWVVGAFRSGERENVFSDITFHEERPEPMLERDYFSEFHAMTDQELATALHDAYAEDARADAGNVILFAENEIAGRLSLLPDESEQGFTPEAQQRIVDWVATNRLKPPPKKLILVYDVTECTLLEVAGLTGEAIAWAERSDAHPSVEVSVLEEHGVLQDALRDYAEGTEETIRQDGGPDEDPDMRRVADIAWDLLKLVESAPEPKGWDEG